MNNLFKKGFASLALASAMTSSIFAGNAAYIDIKVNYLGGEGVAVLGYENTTAKNDNRDKVELLVSILDKDGNFATKNIDGSARVDSVTLAEINSTGTTPDGLQATIGSIVVAPLGRTIDENDNIERFILDYTEYVAAKLEDEITLFTGTGSTRLERKMMIKLGSVDAKGLIVRATPNGNIKTEKYINAPFMDINVSGEASELVNASSKAPGGLVGLSIPIQVYASHMSNNTSKDGRFTFAPNLENQIIVVQALADYNENNKTQTVLNSIEITMKDGQASGTIVITDALPGGIDGASVATSSYVNPTNDSKFEPALSEGLGIAFLVYAKEDIGKNNYFGISDGSSLIKKGTFDENISNWGSSTDTIQVKSGEPDRLIIGKLDKDAKVTSKLWTGMSSLITLVDGNETSGAGGYSLTDGDVNDTNDTHTALKILTVVDSFGNPAVVSGSITTKVSFGGDATNKYVKVTTGNVAVSDGISTVAVNMEDSEDVNNTKTIKSVKFTVDASNGMLAAIDPIALTVKTLPLIEWNVDGGSIWKKSINDINTTRAFTNTANFPLISTASSVVKVTQNDFTLIIKSGLDDANLTDQNNTFRVFIKDNSDDGEYLEGTDLLKYAIEIVEPSHATFGIVGLFGATTATNLAGITSKASDGYIRFDYNSSNETVAVPAKDVNFTIVVSKKAAANIPLANIKVIGYNAEDNEEEVVIKIPTWEDKKVHAFVEAYVDADTDLTEATPGTIVSFKFSGEAVRAGDSITIDMNGTRDMNASTRGKENLGKTNQFGRIGLVGSDVADNTDGKITTTLPENRIVSVVLYDANSSADLYGFNIWDGAANNNSVVLINNARPVWLYLTDDGDTDNKELKITDTFKMARSDDNSIAKVRLRLTSSGSGDGSDDEKRKALPQVAGYSTSAIMLKNETVLTGIYYDIFTAVEDVIFLDKYSNLVSGLKGDIKKDVTFDYSDGIEFDNDGTDSWIKFKESAAGKDQTLTVSYEKDDKSKVSNTITWTKIKLSKKNSGFVITNDANGFVDPNTLDFNVVNSEIIVKIIGNGNKKQPSTKITLTHADKDAKVRLTKVNGIDNTNIYENALSGLDSSIIGTIKPTGNYYIVSADKPGVMTIKVSSKVKDAKDNDVAISSTHTITFDAIDLDKPMVVESGVVASGGTITVHVTDKNLDTVKTLVTVSDINDNSKSIVKAVYTDGKYVAQVSSAGIYQVEILGVDMADNRQRFNFARTVGEGAATLEDSLVAHGSYEIDGKFASHDFKDIDSSFDWVYTQGTTMYQLNAKGSKDASAFKWAEVTDITPGTKNVWYMIKLNGTAGTADAAGAYGWVLVNAKGDTFKLAGANEDGTFKFSKALYVKGTMSGSNISFAKR